MAVSRWTRLAAITAVGALALAGCARNTDEPGAGSGGTDEPSTGQIAPGTYRQPDGGDPVSGGTLTFAEYAETRSLDPAVTIPTGASGGSSMYAIYDSLVRYNQETGEYEPRLAESVELNADHSEWTVIAPG